MAFRASSAGAFLVVALALWSQSADAQEPRLEYPAVGIEIQLPELEFRGWQELWRHVWKRTGDFYEVRPASTVHGLAGCPEDLGIGGIVEQTIHAVHRGRHGDAVERLGEFQDRLHCLTPAGARGVEFALAAFIHLAFEDLPARERQAAVRGAFNLGLLAFDQTLYTGRSWWLPVMYLHRDAIRGHLSRYPGRELGIWLHHLPSATLVAFSFDPGRVARDPVTGPMLAAFGDGSRFGDGGCTLLGMARSGFRCADETGPLGDPGGGTGGAAAAGASVGGAAGDAMTACALSAAIALGHGGAMRCAVRAAGGAGPRLPDHGLSGPLVRGILDEQCAMRSDGGPSPNGHVPALQEASDEERAKEAARAAERLRFESLRAEQQALRHTRDALTEQANALLQAGNQVGAAATRRAADDLQRRLDEVQDEINELLFEQGRDRRPGDPDGACADGTNAAQRVASMYSCMSGGRTGPAAGIGDPREPVVRPGPDATGGAVPSGLLSCHLQGGSLVRGGLEDGRCSVSSCPRESDNCSCDAPRGRAAPPLTNWMGARELLFFELGGGITDPPREIRQLRPGIQQRPIDIRNEEAGCLPPRPRHP